MRSSLTPWMIAASLLLAPGAQAEAMPEARATTLSVKPYSATYTVMRGRMRIGEMQVELSMNDNGNWHYVSNSRATGMVSLVRSLTIEERTEFRVVDRFVVPTLHRYTMSGDNRNRDFSLGFDWDENVVSGMVRGEEVSAVLPAGAVDRHTMPVAVMMDMAATRSFPRRHVMVDRGRVRELETRRDGEGSIRTNAGQFDTVRFVQQRLDDPTRRYLFWVATSAEGMLFPVRIQSVDDDGADMTLELIRLSK